MLFAGFNIVYKMMVCQNCYIDVKMTVGALIFQIIKNTVNIWMGESLPIRTWYGKGTADCRACHICWMICDHDHQGCPKDAQLGSSVGNRRPSLINWSTWSNPMQTRICKNMRMKPRIQLSKARSSFNNVT